MVNRELLQKKAELQRTKNQISTIEGICVLSYEEQSIFDEKYLRGIGFYSSTKAADAKIPLHSTEAEIVEQILSLAELETGQIWYLWVNSFLVKFQITDVKKAVSNLWNKTNPNSKGFAIITKELNKMHEISIDSRDEKNILFDSYNLNNFVNTNPSTLQKV